jgi:hypothetical protein
VLVTDSGLITATIIAMVRRVVLVLVNECSLVAADRWVILAMVIGGWFRWMVI